jgi:3-oxoacyl-[acyl-carrier-protein] synthase II
MTQRTITRRRVVITGLGVISAMGHNLPTTWQALKSGQSGIAQCVGIDTSLYQTHYAAEVKEWRPERYMDFKDARRMDIYQQYAVVAAAEAVGQAGLTINEDNCERVSVIVSTSTGGHTSYDTHKKAIDEGHWRRVSPFAILQYVWNGGAAILSIEYGAQGPTFAVVSSCATGADNIGAAYKLVRDGEVDAAIAGCADFTSSHQGFASLDRINVLSHWSGKPEESMKPFNRERDGLILGSGAGILVLEALETAQARGAHILAELVGYGNSADAYHLTSPDENGKGGALAMQRALRESGLQPEQIDYINAHGTATLVNDLIETRALKRALGDCAYQIPISSTKPMTGHAMGTTAAMEAAFCVKIIQEGLIPPTLNLHDPDPACDLDYVPQVARQHPVRVAMSNSLGLGGHNASLILTAFTP